MPARPSPTTLSSDPSGKFEVVGNEIRLKTGATLDYETATSHQVDVTVTDAGGLTRTETVNIAVTNQNEAPTDITVAGGSVQENAAAGTVVATLGATDPDAGSTFTYSLTSDPSGKFEIVGNEIRLKTGATLDYETATSHNVNVTVTDAGGLTRTETVNIAVTNQNEAPTDITVAGGSVQENAAAGTVVATLGATDPDAGSTFTYYTDSDPSGKFEIVGNEIRQGRRHPRPRGRRRHTRSTNGCPCPELEDAIRSADSKTRLEDLYAPHRPKKRSKAQIAREQGLEPLADALLASPALMPEQAAAEYVNEATGVVDVAAALDGARAILIERFSEAPELVGGLRTYVWEQGTLRSTVVAGQEEKGAKFRDYFDAQEPVSKLPSHRVLALLRGRKEGVLKLAIVLPDEDSGAVLGEPERRIAAFAGVTHQQRPSDDFLRTAVTLAWKARLQPKLENDVEQRLREMAEDEAIRVFGTNLRDLLLAAPAGTRVTMGLDPGIRTGVKVAVVGNTGAVVATTAVFPHEPKKDWDGSIAALAALCVTHKVDLVAIGNGTASRETEKLVAELMDQFPALTSHAHRRLRGGGSVYSASELASKELPELDVTLRGAVSIARRLQDPLAELVKIEPRSIGVGQYQHDVSQPALARQLDGVVEDCVNAVGADVNTASPALLARISGLNSRLAAQIVDYRTQHGPFSRRAELREVPRLGDKTFEQAAGFLRILNGPDVLDASAVHPEAYPVVQRIAQADRARSAVADWRQRVPAHARSGAVRRRAVRHADGARHPGRTREARSRSAPRVQDGEVQGLGPQAVGSRAGHGARGRRDQRRQFRRVRRRRRPSGRARPRLAARRSLRQGPARRRQGRADRLGDGARSGHRRASASR